MRWSPQQDDALKAVSQFLADPSRKLFYLAGFAGTGKTTLAREFAKDVAGTVLFGAYTGKAAYVLRQKGCPGASTVHSMIYHAKDKGRARLRELENELVETRMQMAAEGSTPEQIDLHPSIIRLSDLIDEERTSLARPMFALNPESPVKDAALIAIDECSMIDDRMGEDLLSFGTKVLVLGDPAQLPPVGSGGYFTSREPDFMLTEIHRQARDNPIIEMATRTRNHEALPLGTYGTSRVIDKADLRDCPEAVLAADQLLVGKNVTRYGSNRRCRALKGIETPLPIVGDRLVCLRNNHDRGLLNGAIWHVHDVGDLYEDRILLSLTPDDGEVPEPLAVEAHTHYFLKPAEEKLGWWERNETDEFDFGYALTVHKSQGSQWPNVMLFDEAFCFRQDKWKWLYTGITRAADQLTVVRM